MPWGFASIIPAAAYAAESGLDCIIVIPGGKIALGKLAQAMMHGAAVIQIKGNFDANGVLVLRDPDAGERVLTRGARVAMLPQDVPPDLAGPVREVVAGAADGALVATAADATGAPASTASRVAAPAARMRWNRAMVGVER